MHSIQTYRNIVEKMLQNPETLENVITAAPGLHDDPVTIEWCLDQRIQDDNVLSFQSCLHNIKLLLSL